VALGLQERSKWHALAKARLEYTSQIPQEKFVNRKKTPKEPMVPGLVSSINTGLQSDLQRTDKEAGACFERDR
jgi:hypothetical protein